MKPSQSGFSVTDYVLIEIWYSWQILVCVIKSNLWNIKNTLNLRPKRTLQKLRVIWYFVFSQNIQTNYIHNRSIDFQNKVVRTVGNQTVTNFFVRKRNSTDQFISKHAILFAWGTFISHQNFCISQYKTNIIGIRKTNGNKKIYTQDPRNLKKHKIEKR